MYQINTILTFTSLTHASAAADLFGSDALDWWRKHKDWLRDYIEKNPAKPTMEGE